MAGSSVIRSDIVEVDFDIQLTPFNNLLQMVDDLETRVQGLNLNGLESFFNNIGSIHVDHNELERLSNELQEIAQRFGNLNNPLNIDTEALREFIRLLREVRDGLNDVGNQSENTADEVKEHANSMSDAFDGLKGIIAGVVAALGMGAAIDNVANLNQAVNKFQAQTGVSNAEMEQYSESIKNLYGQAMGESLEDCSNTLALVNQQFKELDPKSTEEIAYNAMLLSDTFEMDVNESLRGVDALMQHMGISSEEAFNFIAKGAQNGLNKTDELTDNIAEYAQTWAQAGFTTEEMFSVLQNGLDSGAYNLDKVNDFVKEFTVSLSDGRIEENISSFSSGTQNLFKQWKNGEASQKDVFNSVISDLGSMTNEQEALTLASEVWSALGEDNAMSVITSLSTVNDAYSDVAGTMDEINKIRYDDINTALEALKRNFELLASEALAPAVGRLADFVNQLTELIKNSKSASEFGEGFAGIVTDMATEVAGAIPSVVEGAAGLITGLVSGLASGMPMLITTLVSGVFSAAISLVNQVPAFISAGIDLLMGLLQGILAAIPIILQQAPVLIQSIVDALIVATPLLLSACVEIIQMLMTGIFDNLPVLLESCVQIIQSLVDGVQRFLPLLVQGAFAVVMAIVDGILQNLEPLLSCAIQLILALLQGVMDMLPSIVQAGMVLLINLVLGILQALPQIVTTAYQMILTFITSIVEMLPDILEMGFQLVGMLIVGLFQALPDLIVACLELAWAFIQSLFSIDWLQVGWDLLTTLLTGVFDGIKTLGSSVWDGIKSMFSGNDEEIKMEGLEAAQSYGDGITAGTPQVKTQADGLASNVKSGLNLDTSAFTLGTSGANSFASGLSAGLPTVSTTSAGLSSTATSNLSFDAFSIGSTASADFASGISASTDNAISAASTLSASVQTAAEPDIAVDVDVEKATASMKSLEMAANSAVTTVQGHFTKMETGVTAAMSKIVSKVQSTNSALYSAGKSIMQGLQNGILSMENSLISTASRIARNISTAINSELDIHSPSRVTEESGINVGLGAVRGMQKMIPNIQDASLDIGATMATGVSYANDYGYGTSSSYSRTSTTTTNHYSPQFTLNMNGASATDSNKRKVKAWIREAMREMFDELECDNPPVVEV